MLASALAMTTPLSVFAEQASPVPGHSPAPARHATLQERHGSGVHGEVTLIPQGSKTDVKLNVTTPHNEPVTITIHSGRDCQDVLGPVSPTFTLNPVTHNQSNTIIAVPLSSIGSKNFVVDVRNATTRKSFAEACAQL